VSKRFKRLSCDLRLLANILLANIWHSTSRLLDQELIPYRYPSSSCSCWDDTSKSRRLPHFKSDRDEIWQDCSESKYASIDEVGFWYDVILSRRQPWRPPAARCSSVRRLPSSSPSACDVICSLYALQFLTQKTLVLVC